MKKKIEQMYKDFANALGRLKEVLKENPSAGSIVVDGTIQRFEFTFELAWKLMKAILAYNGIEAATPRQAIKEGFRANIIEDGDSWIDMMEDRNKTSHIYDENQALVIYNKIKNNHFKVMENFLQNSRKFAGLEDEKAG